MDTTLELLEERALTLTANERAALARRHEDDPDC